MSATYAQDQKISLEDESYLHRCFHFARVSQGCVFALSDTDERDRTLVKPFNRSQFAIVLLELLLRTESLCSVHDHLPARQEMVQDRGEKQGSSFARACLEAKDRVHVYSFKSPSGCPRAVITGAERWPLSARGR
jgi:hypothetical protein